MSARAASLDRRGWFDWLTLGSAFLSVGLTVVMVLQTVQAGSGYSRAAPSSQSIVAYWSVAGLLVALQVGLLVRAVRQGRVVLGFISTAALLVAVGAALLLSVPAIDWRPDPPAHTLDPNYRPCYSGSGDCVGG